VKPQVSINSSNSSLDCKKTANGNGNFQPEIASYEYSSTRVSPIRQQQQHG